MVEFLGWFGAACFSLCALPQVTLVLQQGHAEGLSPWFILLWAGGEVCMIAYVILTVGWDGPLLTNYIFNFACVLVLAKYRFWPKGGY